MANENIGLEVVDHRVGHPKAMEVKQTRYHNNCKHNKVFHKRGSVAGAKTTEQKFQDQLVLSNRFRMLQPLVDNQEQEQQISYGSSVQPAFSTKNKVQRKKVFKIGKQTIQEQVDDSYELTLAHQDKKSLVGNKNETGLFDGESPDVITPIYQSWSVADTNTHVLNLDQMLTGNWDLDSIEHENSCLQKSRIPVNTNLNIKNWRCYLQHYWDQQISRIPVNTNLNIKNWRRYLQHYWDQQILDLLQYGFPLDFDRNCSLQSTNSNHKSAEIHLDQVKNYIKEELSHGAIIGPFDDLPPLFHVSPLITRDKQDSHKKRTIMDLSWPKGNSVNDGVSKELYLGTSYTLHYPSIDNITTALCRLGPGAKIFKIDISRAFRHLRVDPADIDLLGLQVDGHHFLDVSTPFGYRNGSLFFQRCSDAIRYIMADHGFPELYNDIDDLIYVGLPSKIGAAFKFLTSLLAELGLEVSSKKLVPPTSVICLGILIDSQDRTISIPHKKLGEIVDLCTSWTSKTYCGKRDLQSLLGHLLYIAKCVRPAKIFLNRMLETLRDNVDNTKILLTEQFFRDLNWFNVFLKQYNGITFYDSLNCYAEIHLDASFTGLGAIFDSMIYSLPINKNYMGYNIVQLEFLTY